MGARNMSGENDGVRFEFGENWTRFLKVLSEERIREAEAGLIRMLDTDDLRGKTFVDVGSGSGLSSLAARRLGARVHSFDYDARSVACTGELKRRYFPGDGQWAVAQGSVLDEAYLDRLGQFDIVYSWGVLHHTGAMWQALGNVDRLVAPDGRLFIAIYNTQRPWTSVWRAVKRTYQRLPGGTRPPFVVLALLPLELRGIMYSLLTLRPQRYLATWTHYHTSRGMSRWHDMVDWVGGYPFETATPDEIFDLYKARGYALCKLRTCGGRHGCNEYVFSRR